MGKVAVHPSMAIAELLKRRREELGLSLREVEAQSAASGDRVNFATLSRAEQGKAELGTRRLYRLFKIYDLPIQLAADLLELEEAAGTEIPTGSFDELGREGVGYWQKGDLRKALARFFTLRTRTPSSAQDRLSRQKAILRMAVAAASLGRVALSRYIVENLLLEPPEPSLLVNALVHAARCWHDLGSCDVALGFLARAEARLAPQQYQERAWVFHVKASCLTDVGDFDAAAMAFKTAIAAYRRARDTFGEALALAVRVRLEEHRGDWPAMLRVARAARSVSRRRGFKRLEAFRGLGEARALLKLDRAAEALGVLREVLAWSIQADDRVTRFYAHHDLWKAYQALGDLERANLELRAAKDHLKFVDELTPETREVREQASRSGAEAPRRRKRRAS
jgi:tetratricopeptide (TPR) repeat protein